MKLEDLQNVIKAEEILDQILSKIYLDGPINISDLETLSYLSLFQPQLINEHIDDLNLNIGLFYKETDCVNSLQGYVHELFKSAIQEHFGQSFTPVQASILTNSSNNRIFSFSAPTSTGKSYVLLSLIKEAKNDVVIVVPSRALINEYYLRLCEEILDKSINILTFVDKINTNKCSKNIFILTPERCRDLFKLKNLFLIDLILFDEAQLTDEIGKRGLFFDAIVRRCNRELPNAKILFAHPFISNPEAQITKNQLQSNESKSLLYKQRNVGQIFVCKKDDGHFYYFGSNIEFFGSKQLPCEGDPIEKCIKRGGSVLFYVSKRSILTNGYLNTFSKYIQLCSEIENPEIQQIIDELKAFTGGETIAYMNYYSQMLDLLKRGIVIHHGSLPLHARVLIEKFTRNHYCKICFATSTLEQGINMPFDIVYIDRLEASKKLSVKNLIGRAGRSSTYQKFDYGIVIISSSKVSKLRDILKDNVQLNDQSQLDNDEELDDEYNDFKDAIINNTFSDEFNLTQNQIRRLSNDDLNEVLICILDNFFENIDNENHINLSQQNYTRISSAFNLLYSDYLGRELQSGEKSILNTALDIMIWKIQGKTFSTICHSRYAYISRQKDRSKYEKIGKSTKHILAKFTQKYVDFPDNTLIKPIPLFPRDLKACDVDYDLITYDTYDFLDKLIGLYLSDIFFAAFIKFNERNPDDRAIKMANLIKYGTFNTRYIWMLRYGMSFEDIEVLDKYIISIDETGIVVNESFHLLAESKKNCISRFVD